MGLENNARGFTHVTIRIMAGRNEQAQKDFSQRVTDGMLGHMPKFDDKMAAHLSVEVVDIDRGSYRKVKLD